METVPLGRTGMRITRTGFGAWAIGGAGWRFAWGPQDDDASIAAIRQAVTAGVNWIDTAAIYGLGHSEEIVRRALADLPAADRPYVFTKCGIIADPANPTAAPARVGAPDSLRREVDQSLRRLGVEHLDLYQMHQPAEDGTPLAEYWSVLVELRAAGKVRAVGLSNHDAAALAEAEAIGHVDTMQPPFSAIHRDAAGVIAACAAQDTGTIVYSPMQAGLLTGAFSAERAAGLPASDWRRGHPDFSGDGLRRNLALTDALRPVAERYDTTLGAVAVAWTLAWPGVTGAIVGARSAGQVDGWLPAATLRLADADVAEIAAAIAATGAGSGPVLPG